MKPTRKLLKAYLQANRALLFLFLGLVGNTTVMAQSGPATPHPTAELSGIPFVTWPWELSY